MMMMIYCTWKFLLFLLTEGEFPEGSLQYLCGGNLREMSVGIIGGKTSQPFSDMDFASEPRTLRYIMVFK